MRTYGDGCAIARALDLVGERWALLVVRELLLGPKRYTDLPGPSQREPQRSFRAPARARACRGCPAAQAPPPAGSRVYELTDWGLALEEIVISLGRWAARSPTPPGDAPIVSADSVVLALRGLFDPGAAHGLRARYELRLGEDRFHIELADEEIEVARGGADQADATIDTDPGTLDAVLWGGLPLADAQRSGKMTIEGDKAAVERFVRLFPMPEPAAAVTPA